MKTWIGKYYIKPNSTVFKFLDLLNKKLKLVILAIFISLTIFPFIQWLNAVQKNITTIEKITRTKQELNQQNSLYLAIKNRQQQQNNQNNNLAKMTEQVEHLLQRKQISVESLQWYTEEGKNLTIIAHQQANPIFDVVEELGKMSLLRIKTLTLTKQKEHRLIQLNMTLGLTYTEEE